jgi:adenosylcobinamide-phosphate synthase
VIIYSHVLWVLCGALILDAIIGDPERIWRHWPHPVVWFGVAIDALDHALNRESWTFHQRRMAGVLALASLVAICVLAGVIIEIMLRLLPFGEWASALAASIFIAQKSLHLHVKRVQTALVEGGLDAGRQAVAMIVGRDVQALDEAGVSRASIESAAENFSDGVVAPAFWFALFGLPGLFVYKAVNTADSMIGHKTPQHAAFGWAAARCDDGLNLIPARFSGLLVVISAAVAGGSIKRSLAVMVRDAHLHRSPNAGWPESAMAGALSLALGGPRAYPKEGQISAATFNEGARREATADDIWRALRVLTAAGAMHLAVYVLLAWAC